jgi:hypothetical protein
VKAVLACVLVLSVAALAAGVESGHACSCALPDARAALAQADGAFVGRLVARRQEGQSAILTYAVERTLKGPIGPTIEVRTASNGAACGIEAPIGTRAGLVLDRRGGAWNGHLCWQFDADELLTAALPLPPPNGRGQVALIAGGEFGDVRLLALDANGRTLAYGRGGGRTGLVSVCPGRQRIAELAYTGQGTVVVIRRTRTLRILRRQALVLPGRRYAQRLSCGDRTGTSVVVFARGPSGDSPAKSALYDVRAGRLHAIWNGAAFDAALTPSNAFLSAGLRGRNLLRVDLTTGSARVLATLPGPLTALQVNAAATLLAGVETRVDRSAQVVRFDLREARAKITTARLPAEEGLAQVFWLPGGRLLFAPTYGRTARVLDESLRTRSRFGWSALSAAVAANELFGTDLSLALYRADLPSGPQRVARSLPGRTHVLVSATR